VVAWHGNYAPVKYDMRNYCPVGAILFDHPDPSIFTVLTAPSGVPGTANIDFVLFRERWMVMEDTFRPPWYHKNIMSELMGNIYGQYDAKPQGFVPGGVSLHNMMLPHGPDRDAFEKASNADLKPEKLDNTMSFMFETRFPQHLTEFAAKEAPLQDDYIDCWDSLEKKFDGTPGKKCHRLALPQPDARRTFHQRFQHYRELLQRVPFGIVLGDERKVGCVVQASCSAVEFEWRMLFVFKVKFRRRFLPVGHAAPDLPQ
jgi:hypothetical protein